MYQKIAENGFILGVIKGVQYGTTSEDEYNLIINTINDRPIAPDGYDYHLREDLTWELYELPSDSVASDDEEITDEEAYNIIMGVSE